MKRAKIWSVGLLCVAQAGCDKLDITSMMPGSSSPQEGDEEQTNRNEGKELWSWNAGDRIMVTPVVDNSTVFLGSTDGYAYAVKAKGTELWKERAGMVTGGVATDGQNLYVSSKTGIFAFRLSDGTEIWDTDLPGRGCSPTTSSLAIADSRLFVATKCDGLHALDISSGKKLWNFETGERGPDVHGLVAPAFSGPTAYGGMVFIGSRTGQLYALDAASGKTRWTFKAGGEVVSTPAVGSGMVFITAGGNETEIVSSPVYADEFVYVGATSPNLYALNALDGQRVWSVDLGQNKNSIYAFFAANGEKVWSTSKGSSWVNTPAIDERCAYFGDHDGMFWAIERASGAERWQFRTGGRVVKNLRKESHLLAAPATHGDSVFVPSTDSILYVLGSCPAGGELPATPSTTGTVAPSSKAQPAVPQAPAAASPSGSVEETTTPAQPARSEESGAAKTRRAPSPAKGKGRKAKRRGR